MWRGFQMIRHSNLVRHLSSSEKPLFDKILVANRGEIAIRVFRTARKLGIKTVAVYSTADADGCHVRAADESICIGPTASAESYLSIPKIMKAIEITGAQAVHPGYGFLSENCHFAEELEKAGVVFIGPNPHAINAMGDKIESKKLAKSAGVNTIPGHLGVIQNTDEAVKIANEIGYPVMIKASAGGGGKGMRIAYNDKEAVMGFKLATDEAIKSFGDGRIFIEKFIEDPRHIEIQLIADSLGNVVTFPERECSIQRRNQKVIEESPSTLMSPSTRATMQDQAAALARAVKYNSAGTVEFVADNNENFYFLEMNTRLQVEHPITELITGVDLVEQMIRSAAGIPLSDSLLKAPNGHMPFHGWAIESRVYAEDPVRGFLPSTGRLTMYREPSGENVRVDSGVTEGSEISMFYDPMICKLSTYGETRDKALDTMVDALDSYIIRGLRHNISFLREVYEDKRFRSGKITTKYIAEEYPDGFKGIQLSDKDSSVLIAFSAMMQATIEQQNMTISGKIGGFELFPDEEFICSIPKIKENVVVKILEDEIHYRGDKVEEPPILVQVGDQVIEFDNAHWVDARLFRAEVNGEPVVIQFLEECLHGFQLQFHGEQFDVFVQTKRETELSKYMIPKKELDTSNMLVSPMPGALVSVAVKPGDEVVPGQVLAIVEAMKMQNVLYSETTAVVKSVDATPGQNLDLDQVIIQFEPKSK